MVFYPLSNFLKDERNSAEFVQDISVFSRFSVVKLRCEITPEDYFEDYNTFVLSTGNSCEISLPLLVRSFGTGRIYPFRITTLTLLAK